MKLKSKEDFIKDDIKINGELDDRSEVRYINGRTPCKFRCLKHGVYWQVPQVRLLGHRCPKCKIDKVVLTHKYTQKDFENAAKKVHGEKDSLEEFTYVNSSSRGKLTCKVNPKHGVYWMVAKEYLIGHRCPKCRMSKGENRIQNWLFGRGIEHITQKRFNTCINKRTLPFDFYLPKFGVLIEYQGSLHFIENPMIKEPKKRKDYLENQQFRDSIKKEWCLSNNIPLISINYMDFDKIDSILENNLK